MVSTLTSPTVQVYTPPSERDPVPTKTSSPNCVLSPITFSLEKDGSVVPEDTQGKRKLSLLLMTVRLDGGARTMVSSVAGVAEGQYRYVGSC